MTETVLTPVVCTVEIAAPCERVFELFTTPERLVGHVEVELTELDDGGTRVELRHIGWQAVPEDQVAEWRGMHEAGWVHFLGCLRDLAEGRPVDESWGPS